MRANTDAAHAEVLRGARDVLLVEEDLDPERERIVAAIEPCPQVEHVVLGCLEGEAARCGGQERDASAIGRRTAPGLAPDECLDVRVLAVAMDELATHPRFPAGER